MKLAVLFLALFSGCFAQNFLLFGNDDFYPEYTIEPFKNALDTLGYSYREVYNTVLDPSDFDGVDVFLDLAVTYGACDAYYTPSIPAIQEFLLSGGAAFYLVENGGCCYTCSDEKVKALLNPYILNPISVSTSAYGGSDCVMATVLPEEKLCT